MPGWLDVLSDSTPILPAPAKICRVTRNGSTPRDDSIPFHVAAHQIIVVAPVTVADEVGVVFVKPNFVFGRQFQISAPRAFGQDPFACFVLRDELRSVVHSGVEYSGCA